MLVTLKPCYLCSFIFHICIKDYTEHFTFQNTVFRIIKPNISKVVKQKDIFNYLFCPLAFITTI